MLTKYIAAAMERAHYEILEDGSYYGEIPGLQGVYANETTLEECRRILNEALEDWIMFRLKRGHDIPEIDGISLEARELV